VIICKAPGRTQSHDNLAGWQRNIGYVPQTTYLIDDSVRRNVAHGVPEAELDDERVWLALRMAQVGHLVRSLPGEMGAIVGERGGRLSAENVSDWGSREPSTAILRSCNRRGDIEFGPRDGSRDCRSRRRIAREKDSRIGWLS
jgi:hypothetical protein